MDSSYQTKTAFVSFKGYPVSVSLRFESAPILHTVVSLLAILFPDQAIDFCIPPSCIYSSLDVFWCGSHSVCILLLILSLNKYY